MIVLINLLMYSGYFGLIPCSHLLYLFLTRMELSLIILFMLEPFSIISQSLTLSNRLSINILAGSLSIIAPSTISQISYMFIALLINPIFSLYHIIIHSLFKAILSLSAGSLIHIQYNYQNIYQIKMNYKFY